MSQDRVGPPVDTVPKPAEHGTVQEARKLAAIMFTDMVGFSRLMHEDELKGLRLLDECNALISDAVTRHHGRILKKMGDAVLAEFSSATAAVTCAVQIQTSVRDHNAAGTGSGEIVLRIGIHLGDVIVRDQDLFGDGINVAARLEPLSEPGGICLSEAVYHAIASGSSVKPILVGEVELKNILQKQIIYRIPAFYGSAPDGATRIVSPRKALSLGGVDRVTTLPPPRRGMASMLVVMAIALPISSLVGMVQGVALASPAHKIWVWEMIDPESMVAALQTRSDPMHERVWEALDADTRGAITRFEAGRTPPSDARRTIRRLRLGLNKQIGAARPIFDPTTVTARGPDSALPEAEVRRINRALLESAFPGTIQRYVSEPSVWEVLGRLLSSPSSWILWAILVPAMVLGTYMGAYTASLRTLRIHFDDLRDVDALLDFHIPDLGFKQAERKGDDLVFGATLSTAFMYNVLRLRARVSGNTVVLTGPTPMMRRLKKQMLLLAAG